MRLGLQIRLRRFDSDLGLHHSKAPQPLRLRGFSLCAEKPDRFRIIWHRFRISPLFGRADHLADTAINPLGDLLLGVPKQPAGVADVLNLRGCLGSDITELELANFAGQV